MMSLYFCYLRALILHIVTPGKVSSVSYVTSRLTDLGLSRNEDTRMTYTLTITAIKLSNTSSHTSLVWINPTYCISQEICTRFCCACFVVVMQSFIMNSHEVFIHIHQGCFAGTGAIVRLPQCQWSKPDGYGKISQCITTSKHSKAKIVCTFLGIYCIKCKPFGHTASWTNLADILRTSAYSE